MESPRSVFERQMRLIEAAGLDGLLEQYDEDAVLVRFDRVIGGRDGLREFFAGYLAEPPRIRSVDAYAETDDVVSYQATLQTAGGEVRGYGGLRPARREDLAPGSGRRWLRPRASVRPAGSSR